MLYSPIGRAIYEAFKGLIAAGGAIGAGAKSLAFGGGVSAIWLAVHWSGSDPVSFFTLAIALIPACVVAGVFVGSVIGPTAQWLTGVLNVDSGFRPIARALTFPFLAVASYVPFGAWASGGLSRITEGDGALCLTAAATAGAIAGVVFALVMQRYESGGTPTDDWRSRAETRLSAEISSLPASGNDDTRRRAR